MPESKKQNIPFKGFNGKHDSGLANLALQSLPAGVIVYDDHLKVISSNPAAFSLVDVQSSADVTLSTGANEKIWGNWQKILLDVIDCGKSYRFDSVEYALNDSSRVLQIICVPMEHSVGYGMVFLQDVTAQANAQKQSAHNERLITLGRLSSKIAHELNNPIDGIMRYINLARRAIGQGPEVSKPIEYLDHANSGLKRMIQVIADLLEFSRVRHATFEDMPIDKIVDDAVKFISPSADAMGIEMDRAGSNSVVRVKGDNLFSVFCNLLKNAVEATPKGGRITIKCSVSDDNFVVVKISDTGHGFDSANREIMFEAFFTTKTGGKGTGLGLAICRDIVEKHGGKITAENLPSGGACFSVFLPLADV